METWLQLVLASVASFGASSGFWAYMQHKDVRRSATTRLLMGLAYEKLTSLGVQYIENGEITMEEYEEYRKYFYEPYKALGGNGVAEQIMYKVSNLPLASQSRYTGIIGRRPEENSDNVRTIVRAGYQDPSSE